MCSENLPQTDFCAQKVLQNFSSKITELKASDHPLLAEGNLKELYRLATITKRHITKKNSNKQYKVFSLGQSPAYLIEMMKAIDQAQDVNDTTYDFIAFSGHLWTLDHDSNWLKKTTPSAKALNRYKEYLKLKFPKKDTSDIVIIEFPQRANGIYSFFKIASNLDQLPKHFRFLLGVSPNLKKGYVPDSEIFIYLDDEINRKLIIPLANTDNFDDRLVMHYPYYKWETKDPTSFKPSYQAELLKDIIRSYVDCINKDSKNNPISRSPKFFPGVIPKLILPCVIQ